MGARAVVRKADGKWIVRVNHKGARRTKVFGRGQVARRAAEAAATQLQARLALGDVGILQPAPTVPTLREQAESWLRNYAAVYCQPATQRNYALAFRDDWLPALGALPLTDLTRERVNAAVGQLRGRLKPSSIKSSLIPLRACLNAAIEAGHLATDPTKGIGKLLARQAPAEQVDPRELFAWAELERIVETARCEMSEHFPAVLTLARTAVRIGEALALQVDDVDPSGVYVSVRRTLSRGRLLSLKPKGKRNRHIEMSDQLREALRGQVSLVQAEAALRGEEATWLFPWPSERASRTRPAPGTTLPLYSSWFRRYVWRPLLRRAGVRYRPLHTVRHTVASKLLADGVPLARVSELLGHHSPAFTAKVYAHALPGGDRGVMNRLDTLSAAPIRNSAATDVPEPITIH